MVTELSLMAVMDNTILHLKSEKAMAPHSSTLPWKIPWMEEPSGLQSMGSQTVGNDLVTKQQKYTRNPKAITKKFRKK